MLAFIFKAFRYFLLFCVRFFFAIGTLALIDFIWKMADPAGHDSRVGQVVARIVINLVIIRFVFLLPIERWAYRGAKAALRNRRRAYGVAAFVMAIVLSGCFDPDAQRSAIVREVESAGAGNISTYSQPGLAEWFSHRPQLAQKISAECFPVRQIAQANWATSAEGTVCLMAERMAPPPPVVADPRSW